MIFVNYIAGMKGIPFILRHAKAEMDTYTITDLVFPGFLFIVGVAIPLSLSKRILAGDSTWRILKRIAVRTASLLFLGIIMVNEERFSAADTGLSKELWYFLAYASVVVLWNIYSKTTHRRRHHFYLALRIAAVALLVFLVVIFRGRTEAGTLTWLQPFWWGILGQIGWAYLVCSIVYLLFRGNRTALMGTLSLMIAYYIGSSHGALDFLGPISNFIYSGFKIVIHCAIVMAGVLVGTLFTAGRDKISHKARSLFLLLFGLGLYVSGILLRPLHGISKIRATDSFALVTSGVCCLAFMAFYLLMDVLKVRRWASFLQPIGKNPLLAYILPSIVDYLLSFASWLFHINVWRVFWLYLEHGGLAGMLNAAVVTAVILLITWAMTRARIILKL
jgi:predicted acyltransferase